jgi:hypothetical protein
MAGMKSCQIKIKDFSRSPCPGDQGKDCLHCCGIKDLREDESREDGEHSAEDLSGMLVPAERRVWPFAL